MRRAAALGMVLVVWVPVAAAQESADGGVVGAAQPTPDAGVVGPAPVIEANSTTVLRLAPDWRAGDTRTGFWGTEIVGLTVRGIEMNGVDDLKIQLSAWGQLASLSDPVGTGNGTTGDIDLLFVQGALLNRRLNLTLGRQLVSGGAARVLQLDGVNATVAIAKGFGVQAYAGAPVVSRFSYPVGEFAFGGRAFWRPTYGSEIGLSFIEILSGGVVSREDLGLDGRWVILPNLAATASGILNLRAGAFADADLTVSYQVLPTVEVFVKAQHTSPDLYLPMTSIFSVFSNINNDGLGAGVFWQALPRLAFYAEYQRLWVDGGNGDEAELRVTYRITRKATVGLDARILYVPDNGVTPANGINDFRAWVIYPLNQKIKLSGDVDWTILHNELNGGDDSLVGTASVVWVIGSGWTGMLSGSVGTTPFFQARYTATARIGYDFPFLNAKASR
jgi:hypothetical protein